jgi:hypothetical protein
MYGVRYVRYWYVAVTSYLFLLSLHFLSPSLSLSLSRSLARSLALSLSQHIIFIYLYIYIPIYLSIYLSISIYLSFNLSIYVSIYLYIYLPIYICILYANTIFYVSNFLFFMYTSYLSLLQHRKVLKYTTRSTSYEVTLVSGDTLGRRIKKNRVPSRWPPTWQNQRAFSNW